jgi:hypothetical protein
MARVFTHTSRWLPAALALALAGCGGDESSSQAPASTSAPAPTATIVPDASPTATAESAPSPPPDAPTPTPTATGEDQPGGAGDEAEARVPVEVTVGSDGTVSPRQVAVPAFLALELRVRNRTGGPIEVTWDASEPAGTFSVGAGKLGTRRVAGVKKGSYPLSVAGAGTATVVSGAEPGP